MVTGPQYTPSATICRWKSRWQHDIGRGVGAAFRGVLDPLAGTAAVQTAFGNLNRLSPTAMDTQNPDRGPLLLIPCQKTTWSQTSRSCGAF